MSFQLYAQDTTDADRLKNLEYMIKYGDRINCDSSAGTNLDDRICLNKEFQKQDSILNTTIVTYLELFDTDGQRKRYQELHQSWLEYRRSTSKLKSEGYQGHLLGIRYLATMIVITEKKIEELRYLIEMG